MEKDANHPEDILARQLATCLAAMQDCLEKSRAPADDEYDSTRSDELSHVTRLMKASARLTAALARLKGETSHSIHVTRADKG